MYCIRETLTIIIYRLLYVVLTSIQYCTCIIRLKYHRRIIMAKVRDRHHDCYWSTGQLRQLRPVIRSLTAEATKTLIQAFVSFRLDYCNSLLYVASDGQLIRKLYRSLQNERAVVRLIRPRDYNHARVARLHWLWLLVQRRTEYKVACLSAPVGVSSGTGILNWRH